MRAKAASGCARGPTGDGPGGRFRRGYRQPIRIVETCVYDLAVDPRTRGPDQRSGHVRRDRTDGGRVRMSDRRRPAATSRPATGVSTTPGPARLTRPEVPTSMVERGRLTRMLDDGMRRSVTLV